MNRSVERVRRKAFRIRHHVIRMCTGGEGGHLGGALSCADILAVLYFDVLRVDPAAPNLPERDIFLLSKGHSVVGLYAALAERGFFPVRELRTYGSSAGRLMGHPVRAVPGVELPTGSLGHGLPLGVGFALGGRLSGYRQRTYVLVGDGELQEGSCWEAARYAAELGLDNLVAIVDRNHLRLAGPESGLEPLADKWSAFGWETRAVDGHDHAALREALRRPADTPCAIIAETVKGRGLPILAGKPKSHYATLSAKLAARAHHQLDAVSGRLG